MAARNVKANQGTKTVFAKVAAKAESGEGFTDQDFEVEISGLFVAATDATAISLTYLTWAILATPDLRKRIEDEVKDLRPDYSDANIGSECPLLNAAVEETLRLYGAAPGALPRTVPSEGVDLGGFYMPQGSIVSTQAYSMHRDAKLFPDPLSFKPERWFSDRKDRVSDAGKAMFAPPFEAGSRSCLGLHIAYMDLRLAAVEFFRRCSRGRLAPSTTDESMEFENFFLSAPKAHQFEIIVGEEICI